MKLTVDLRRQIAKNAVKKLHDKHRALRTTIEAYDIEQAVLDGIGTGAERKKMDSLPEGWLKEEKSFSIECPPAEFTMVVIGNSGLITYKKVYPQFKLSAVFNESIKFPHSIYQWEVPCPTNFRDLVYRYQDAHNLAYSTYAEVYNNLRSYKTTEEVAKAWPEGEEFYEDVNPTQVVALAVRWTDTNKKLEVQQ